MATFTATAAAANAQAIMNATGVTTRVVQRTIGGTAISAGDVWQMVKVPSGAVVCDLAFAIDAAAAQSYTLTGIGDGNSANRFVASQSAVISQSVRMSLPAGFGYSYSAEDTIDLTWGTVTSGTAATAIVTLVVSYTVQNGN